MIEIKESNEPLVNLMKVCPRLLFDVEESRVKKEGGVYVRKTVAEMIGRALESLPRSMSFMVSDAWRPVTFQKKLQGKFDRKFRRLYPDWSDEKIKKEVRRYVAPYKGPSASGHLTGGAIDLIICQDGKRLSIKSSKLTYQEDASSHPVNLPEYIKKNRQLMFGVLIHAGLTNYPNEYWHWCYGDTMWAKLKNKKTAIYGIIKDITN